jgi:hypothetical protein
MKHQVIRDLYPNIKYILEDVDFIKVIDIDDREVVIDQSLVDLEITKREIELEKLSYISKRKKEYPPVEEYLDGIVKGDQSQIDTYIDKCRQVKLKYPKPVDMESNN